MKNTQTVEAITVQFPENAPLIAEKTNFSTGSVGFRTSGKIQLNVGTAETPDYRRYQVSVIVTEIHSKGKYTS